MSCLEKKMKIHSKEFLQDRRRLCLIQPMSPLRTDTEKTRYLREPCKVQQFNIKKSDASSNAVTCQRCNFFQDLVHILCTEKPFSSKCVINHISMRPNATVIHRIQNNPNRISINPPDGSNFVNHFEQTLPDASRLMS